MQKRQLARCVGFEVCAGTAAGPLSSSRNQPNRAPIGNLTRRRCPPQRRQRPSPALTTCRSNHRLPVSGNSMMAALQLSSPSQRLHRRAQAGDHHSASGWRPASQPRAKPDSHVPAAFNRRSSSMSFFAFRMRSWMLQSGIFLLTISECIFIIDVQRSSLAISA